MTTGVPVSSSRAHTGVEQRVPRVEAAHLDVHLEHPRTAVQRLGHVGRRLGFRVEGRRLQHLRVGRWANSADHSLSQAAMPALCGYGSVGKARTPSRSRTASRSSSGSA